MLKSLLYMAVATAARLLSGALLFVLIARVLGPENFGQLVLCFSAAMLLALVVEFGHSAYVSRELGRGEQDCVQLLNSVLQSKGLLTVVYAALLAIALAIGLVPRADAFVLAALGVAAVSATYGDIANIAFRATQRIGVETRNVVVGSFIHVLIVAPTAWISGSVLKVSIAFAVSRTAYALLSQDAYRRTFGPMRVGPRNLSEFRNCLVHLRQCVHFATDSGLVAVRGYADVFVVNAILGAGPLGIYQAGMNMVKAIENLAPIVANVYLPKLAQSLDQPQELQRYSRQLRLLLMVCGLIAAGGIGLAPENVIIQVFGNAYAPLVPLFKFFGLYLAARFVAVALGVLATAHGLQKQRAQLGLTTLATLLVLLPAAIAVAGLPGAVVATATVSLILGASLGRTVCEHVGRLEGAVWYSAVILALGSALMCLLLGEI